MADCGYITCFFVFNIAEIEIGILSRQALEKPFPDMESFKKQVSKYTHLHNAAGPKVNWQFSTQDARIKLKGLFTTIL